MSSCASSDPATSCTRSAWRQRPWTPGVRRQGPGHGDLVPLGRSPRKAQNADLLSPEGQAWEGVTVNARRLRDAAIAIGIVFVIAFALAALIGQHNDGPLGDLPEWLGSAAYFIWLLSALLLILVALAAVVLWLRHRGGSRDRTRT
jgi:uncharacterized membrane protein YhdT